MNSEAGKTERDEMSELIARCESARTLLVANDMLAKREGERIMGRIEKLAKKNGVSYYANG